VSGARVGLHDDAFAGFARRDDLPAFDYIGLHGIWSWISDDNRRVIVDFVRRKLKVGGVLYVSYNTSYGWSDFAPLRRLMTEHSATMGAGGIVGRINGALDFAGKLIAADAHYAKAYPDMAERLNKLRIQDRHYLAHEYFNRDWAPVHVSDMGAALGAAKLSYACSADYLANIDGLNLSEAQQALLAGLPNPVFREEVRDCLLNQRFRKDYWVKGPRLLSALERADALRRERILLVTPRAGVSLAVTGGIGPVQLIDAIYAPILDRLADHAVHRYGDIETALSDRQIPFDDLVEALYLLIATGQAVSVQEDADIAAARPTVQRLNRHLMQRTRRGEEAKQLASAATGGGFPVAPFQQLLLLARAEGAVGPEGWARHAWRVLGPRGQKAVQNGRVLDSDAENVAFLTGQAEIFAAQQLAIFDALAIA
jgi:hypothetical protein